MDPLTAQDYVNEAIYSLDDGEFYRAQAEALIGIGLALLAFGDDDDAVPAGPIQYDDYDSLVRGG